MNQNLHAAYAPHQQSGETVRETEARALLSCASKLEAARDPAVSREEFGAAVRHNQKLWTFFQVCLCEPDNPLPRDLKILLLNLSKYVDKTSFRAVTEDNRALLTSLININRTIAVGLAKNNEPKPAAQTAAPPPEKQIPKNLMTSA
jgi:flagellar protein FlaF